jgi:branched-chain amino acid aminotransferase
MSEYISLNGHIIHQPDLHISAQNRAFRYGDGVFESIRIHENSILWEDLHFRRLHKAASQLHLKMMPGWSQVRFRAFLTELYRANHKEDKAARIRLSLFRNEGGYYTPETDYASLLIESEPLHHDVCDLNATGLTLGIYDEIRKPFNILSGLKSINAQLYVLACIYKRDHGYDDVLLLNDEEMIAEATSSNVFIVRHNQLLTPALSQACVEGIMRAVVTELAGDTGISVTETKIAFADLEEADEILLTNAIQGIRWVRQFGHKKYNNQVAIRLAEALKEKIRG